MFRRILLGAALLIILAAAATILALTANLGVNENSQTMCGLEGVCVVVEKINIEAAFDGLSRGIIKNRVEAILGKAGIPVLTENQMLKSPGSPYLYIIINAVKNERTLLYAFNVRAELRQQIKLERNSAISSTAATWQSSEPTGIIGEDKLKLIPAAAEKCTTEFVVAYLKANQK